jgi:hypothetical protein
MSIKCEVEPGSAFKCSGFVTMAGFVINLGTLRSNEKVASARINPQEILPVEAW